MVSVSASVAFQSMNAGLFPHRYHWQPSIATFGVTHVKSSRQSDPLYYSESNVCLLSVIVSSGEIPRVTPRLGFLARDIGRLCVLFRILSVGNKISVVNSLRVANI